MLLSPQDRPQVLKFWSQKLYSAFTNKKSLILYQIKAYILKKHGG